MILYVILIALIVLIDFKSLKQARPKGKIIGVYVAVMILSLLICILLSIGKRPPSPADIIRDIVKSTGVVNEQ